MDHYKCYPREGADLYKCRSQMLNDLSNKSMIVFDMNSLVCLFILKLINPGENSGFSPVTMNYISKVFDLSIDEVTELVAMVKSGNAPLLRYARFHAPKDKKSYMS